MSLNLFSAIFFDLDGTLLDTAPDLLNACNNILQLHGKAQVNLEDFRTWIHGGSDLMVSKSFNISIQDDDFKDIKSEFIAAYRNQLTHQTHFFEGIEDSLRVLDEDQVPWGIITNKLSSLTIPIVNYFGLDKRSCCIVSGDTLPQCKPHPAPLLHACNLINCPPGNAIYIGDTEVDIQAAKAAGMMSIAVGYGYHEKDNPPLFWKSDFVLDSSKDLPSFLFSLRRKNSGKTKK